MKPYAALFVLVVGACSNTTVSPTPQASHSPTPPPPTELVVMTHDSFAVSDDVKQEFEQQSGVTVKILKSGDAGAMVNKAILAKDAPLADVMYGVDNTFLSRALDAGIFEPYQSPALAGVSAEFQLDPDHRVTPIDYGDVCPNYDRSAFTGEVPAPATIDMLIDPQFKNMLVVENPATSSPGLAFLLATVSRFGDPGLMEPPQASAAPGPTDEPGWHAYWQDLKANGVLVSNDWNDAYYNQFSGGSGAGDRPIVISYATSPAAEVVGVDPTPSSSPIGNVAIGCFRQVEFAAVLANGRAAARALAQKWIDFMLSRRFQEDMPLNMFVLPVAPDVAVPDVFSQTGALIADPIRLAPSQIAVLRDRVIREWTDIVLH